MPGKSYDDGQARYLKAVGHLRPMLLDDQVKLNDPGASQYIVETLAQDGWTGLLRYHEGEIWRLRNRAGDDARAALGYAAAVQYPDAPADAWRWHGIMLQKAGRVPEARNAYGHYLAMAPNAPDAPFIAITALTVAKADQSTSSKARAAATIWTRAPIRNRRRLVPS